MFKKATLFFLLFLLLVGHNVVFADEISTKITGRMEELNFDSIDNKIKSIDGIGDISIKDYIDKIISGELSFSISDILSFISVNVFGEIKEQISMLRNLIVIVLLSAVLKNLNTSFQGRSVGELGFYVCYMVLIVQIMSVFFIQVDMVANVLSQMSTIFFAMCPVFFTIAASSGAYAQTAMIAPTITACASILVVVLSKFVLPTITLATSLEMVNNISEKPMLSQFTYLCRMGLIWGMKGMAFLFMTVISLQKLSGSAFNQMASKTAKAAIGAIPVVGDVMGSAVDTAAALSTMVRGTTMAAAIIVLILISAIPLIKLLVMILIYKLTAAAAEPICEGRLVKCICAAGDFSILLFGVLFLADIMFIFSSILILTIF